MSILVYSSLPTLTLSYMCYRLVVDTTSNISDNTYIIKYKERFKMKCKICNTTIFGHGHNAQPVTNGRCCDVCNDTKVLPARMKLMLGVRK